MDSRTDDLQSILDRCSADERAAFEVIARKVMGQGRKTYGPTVLSNDPRDFRREAADELVDALFYWSLEEVKRLAHPPQQKAIEMVRDFHLAFGQPIASTPSISNPDTNELRVKLLDEEVGELEVALAERDPVAVLDALADIQYVLDGAFLSLGFAEMKDAAMREVHRSNMSKLPLSGRPIVRGDGKIQKSETYSPPDLGSLIEMLSPSRPIDFDVSDVEVER